MLEGLNSAAAGMAAQQQRIAAVANDLANLNTTGYKRVRVGFQDLVYQAAGRGGAPDVRVGAGARAVDAGRSFAPGVLRETGRPLDVAIRGDGFLRVRRPDGALALTRDGALEVDARGRLVTGSGDTVEPGLTLPRGTSPDDVSVAPDGTVSANGRRLGRLDLVTVTAPQNLRPLGDNLYAVSAGSGPARPAADPQVTAGALEGSNVDVADAMVTMIEAQRSYSLASRAIQAQDQMLEIANGVKR